MKKSLKYLLFVIIGIFFISRMQVFAYWDDNIDYDKITNPWTQLGEDGEFDYADGDLEDKLGDWGIYEDLFSEDYAEENSNKTYTAPKKTSKYDYIDNTTTDYYYTGTSCGNENKPHYNKAIKNPQVYTGGKWVKRTNWHSDTWPSKYLEDWYYYPVGSTESLKLAWAYIDNVLYFFDRYGCMMHDGLKVLNGITYHADKNGACTDR